MTAYYNEFDPFAAQWLRNLIAADHIAPGDVDERDLWDVYPEEIKRYDQVHLCAGIGIWSLALRRAGWSDSRRVWTGSFPCQPLSAAGKGLGENDPRHLWPCGLHLIRECRPDVVIGEQVASPLGIQWFEGLQADLQAENYAVGAVDTCAAGFADEQGNEGFHIRQRLYWGARRVGHTESDGRLGRPHDGDSGWRERASGQTGADGGVADAHVEGSGWRGVQRPGEGAGTGAGAALERPAGLRKDNAGVDWLPCRDGKFRPAQSRVLKVADAYTGRLVCLRPGDQAEAEKVVAEAAERQGRTPNEIVREVLGLDYSARGSSAFSLRQAQVLFDALLEQERATWSQPHADDAAGAGTPEGSLRVLRREGSTGGSSRGRGLAKRSGREFADAVRMVSSAVARTAQEAGVEMYEADAAASFPLSYDSVQNRVGKLRAVGNALDAAQAEGFVRAWMDCAP